MRREWTAVCRVRGDIPRLARQVIVTVEETSERKARAKVRDRLREGHPGKSVAISRIEAVEPSTDDRPPVLGPRAASVLRRHAEVVAEAFEAACDGLDDDEAERMGEVGDEVASAIEAGDAAPLVEHRDDIAKALDHLVSALADDRRRQAAVSRAADAVLDTIDVLSPPDTPGSRP